MTYDFIHAFAFMYFPSMIINNKLQTFEEKKRPREKTALF